eukprot:scaffold7030_cov191-Pinguiococcus_pyrenoidosus.AAC.2
MSGNRRCCDGREWQGFLQFSGRRSQSPLPLRAEIAVESALEEWRYNGLITHSNLSKGLAR